MLHTLSAKKMRGAIRANTINVPHTSRDFGGAVRKMRAIFRRYFYGPRAGDVLLFLMLAIVSLLLAVVAAVVLLVLSAPAKANSGEHHEQNNPTSIFKVDEIQKGNTFSPSMSTPLALGDRVLLTIENGEAFSGKYQVDMRGQVTLPYAGAVVISGLDPDTAAQAIAKHLEDKQLFRVGAVRATLQVLWWAPLDIHVRGEVFNPGLHRVADSKYAKPTDNKDEIPGGYLPERNLSHALKTAGGITPWADLSQVTIIRSGKSQSFDLRGILTGVMLFDPPLFSNDEIVIPKRDSADPIALRPSSITPPGIRIFTSNLIESAKGVVQNTGSLSLIYGARLSQAIVAANCAGGPSVGSNGRKVTMIRTNRQTGKTERVDSNIDALFSVENDNDDQSMRINPPLQEGDAVVCYESGSTQTREFFRLLTDVLTPAVLFKSLSK